MTDGGAALDPAAVRAVLRRAGLRARHDRSQNFLADVEVLESILAEAGPSPGRRILEIGPGLGILTAALLAAGAAVTAVELDAGLAAWLRERLAGAIDRAAADGPEAPGGLRLIEGDALDEDLVRLVPAPYEVVANLPYHITSPILHRLLGQPPRPERLVLMLQREVAERIAAPPGRMSYLSVFVQYHARARVARLVPPRAFEPPPAVDSAVVVLDPFPADDRLAPAAEDELWRLVQAAFRERRKMLHNVLARQLPLTAAQVEAALHAAAIAPDRRPQTLAVGEWLALREALGPVGPDLRGRRSASRTDRGDGGWPGADATGADGPGADTTGADGPGADTTGADRPGADGPGADGPGADRPDPDPASIERTPVRRSRP